MLPVQNIPLTAFMLSLWLCLTILRQKCPFTTVFLSPEVTSDFRSDWKAD